MTWRSVSSAPAATVACLGTDRHRGPLSAVVLDRAPRGAVAAPGPAGTVRRAEPGPAGPVVLEARPEAGDVRVEVWGPPATPAHARKAALAAARAWAGLGDDMREGFAELVAPDPVLRGLQRRLGTPALSRMPRVGEALGRAVLAQLVQTVEARRSTTQLAALAGSPAPHGLWCWPTGQQLGAVPAWSLRRCGVSLRGAGALHAGAVHDRRLEEARDDWERLDGRLRALPGVGAWTSAETRLALGDPDAVSVGDYHLSGLVGQVLAGEPADDAGMLQLLAPFRGARGRVIRLIVEGLAAGLVRAPARRGPRAALSAHRYW